MPSVVGAVLWFHVATGALALAAGLATLFGTQKGSRRHVLFGITFWHLMTAMAVSGILVAVARPRAVFVLIGLLSLYLIHTGRNALTRTGGVVNRETKAWFVLVVTCFVSGTVLGVRSLVEGREVLGSPFFLYFGVAFDALIFTALDWRLIAKGRAVGKSRVIDHLWRMIAALFFGVFALFVANPQLYPDWFSDTGLSLLPSLALLGVLAYWVVAVRKERWPSRP